MVDKKTFEMIMGILLVTGGALLAGFVLGRETDPVQTAPVVSASDQSVLVTESASPEDADQGKTAVIAQESAGSGKEYTQIVDVLDNMRHVVEERFMAPDGRLVLCEDGYAILRKKYDSAGNTIEEAYYDQEDKPVMVERLGYSRIAM